MSAYKVAEGLDIALVSLVPIVPGCTSAGLKYSRTTYAASGAVIREAPWIELEFSVIGTVTQYNALLALFGLDTAESAEVTVLIPGPLYTFARYSGRAIRPAAGDTVNRQDYFLRDISIIVKDLRLAV